MSRKPLSVLRDETRQVARTERSPAPLPGVPLLAALMPEAIGSMGVPLRNGRDARPERVAAGQRVDVATGTCEARAAASR